MKNIDRRSLASQSASVNILLIALIGLGGSLAMVSIVSGVAATAVTYAFGAIFFVMALVFFAVLLAGLSWYIQRGFELVSSISRPGIEQKCGVIDVACVKAQPHLQLQNDQLAPNEHHTDQSAPRHEQSDSPDIPMMPPIKRNQHGSADNIVTRTRFVRTPDGETYALREEIITPRNHQPVQITFPAPEKKRDLPPGYSCWEQVWKEYGW